MSKKHNNIRVMCRFRPMNDIEQSKNGTIIYKLLKKNGAMIEHPDKMHHPQPMPFYFDRIFDKKSAQVEIFEEAALPLIDNIFEGYNATIFAYGQTGAGKTHTMMGDMIKSEMHPRVGIIPRVVREIWNRIVHASTNYEFELKVSFLEIYNEQIYDLLSTSNNRTRKKKTREKLIIREYADQVFVENLNEIYVRDQNELFDLIKSANKKRMSAETKMNRNSSRSHAVLTILLGQEDIRTGNSKKSKFCLVDLAGSEKVGKTQAKGIRLKEATSINKSLTTLGTCMNKLADNMSHNNNGATMRHIPFRESVLTRLLSDSLGGNCKTTLIINTSPCSYNVEETISTLRFGERAKKIKTKARINQIKTPQQYRKELQAAQTEILKLYRIIEDCSYDIAQAFKGTLNVENCRSYKNLLDLKKYTLNILNGNNNNYKESYHEDGVSSNNVNNSLLANILPDLTNLQSLKKVHTVKKQQKKTGVLNNNNNNNKQPQIPHLQKQGSLRRQESTDSVISISSQNMVLLNNNNNININKQPQIPHLQKQGSLRRQESSDSTISISSQNIGNTSPLTQFDGANKLRRARYGSFEDLDVDNSIKLVRQRGGNTKKIDPLKKKTKQDYGKICGHNANAAFKPPDLDLSIFNVPTASDGLSLGQMSEISRNPFGLQESDYNNDSNIESEFSDYNSEYDNLGIMSPAPDGTQSDASNMDYSMFKYNTDQSATDYTEEDAMDYTDFQEEELPKNFFEMTQDERYQFAKQKRIDPSLIEYRYEISREIDWEQWASEDEEEGDNNKQNKAKRDKEIEDMSRVEIENDNEYQKQRLLMLCRLIRTKSQEYGSRIDIEMSKYTSLASQYRAKNEENSKLMRQNTTLEKLYEDVCTEKRDFEKNAKQLKMALNQNQKKLQKLEKQLALKLNELNIERQNQINLSNNKTSMLRKKIHEKYAEKYKKIENEIIKNNNKDLNIRFNELAKAFKQQSNKYSNLEEVIENSKHQIIKLEELMRQKDDEENALREEIENDDIIRKELILQHNLEIKQIRDTMKKSKNKADMWKRRAFVYKNAVNSLMEEAEFNNLEENDDDDDDDNDNDDDDKSDNPPSFNIEKMSHTTLKPLHSISPRSQLGLPEIEKNESIKNNIKQKRVTKSPRFQVHRKSRPSIGNADDSMIKNKNKNIHKNKNRGREKYIKSSYNRCLSPMRNDAFHMTPSQKAALTSVKMKIRGGGGSDEDVYRTPVKTPPSKAPKMIEIGGNITGLLRRDTPRRHKRQSSQPLNQSLPPPRPTGYSSDDMPNIIPIGGYGDKSRSPVPVIGIDNLIKSKSIEIDENAYHQSPSPLMMMGGYPAISNQSPRGSRKKGTSPLPPPPRSQKLYQASNIKYRSSMDADLDDSDDDDFDQEFNDKHNTDTFLSPNNGQFTSPAGSFFSKIKHTADTPIIQQIRKPIRKQAVSMPEPTGCSDDDEFDEGFSDSSNFSDDDDNNESYKKLPSRPTALYQSGKIPMLSRSDSGSRSSKKNVFSKNVKLKNRRAVVDNSMD